MLVKFKANVFENGILYKTGDIAEIDDERVPELGNLVEVIKKALDEPEKDKMIRKAKKK